MDHGNKTAGEATWTCPTCEQNRSTAFCPTCGEKRTDEHSLTLTGLAENSIEALTHADGRILKSVRFLFTRPGFLTVAFIRGQRKPYLGPIQLFLIANAIFFATQSLIGSQVFSTPLHAHMEQQFYSDIARPLATRHIEATHRTLQEYEPVFDRAAEINSKSLVFLMMIPLTLVTLLLCIRSRRPFAEHLVFALHLLAFMLFTLVLLLALAWLAARLGAPGESGGAIDHGSLYVFVAAMVVYLWFAIRTAFGIRGMWRVMSVPLLSVAMAAIIFQYRFAVFVVTLYTT